jgi:hypothetical protein
VAAANIDHAKQVIRERVWTMLDAAYFACGGFTLQHRQ